mgnify:CR=1 FL=1
MNPVLTLVGSDKARAAEVAAGLDASAWAALDRQAGQHRLRPLLHVRAVEGRWLVPPDLAREWQESHRRSARRALGQKATLARIGKSFAQAGVTAAVLKGGAFVWSGAIDPALRPMRDLDLLIGSADVEAATELLAALGFVVDPQSGPSDKHLPAMINGRTIIELHLRIFDTQDAAAAEREAAFIARAWRRAVAAQVQGMQMFCPTDTLLHVIMHSVLDHQFNNGPLLLVDMPALVASHAVDWTLLWREAELVDATRACQLALALGEKLCGLAVDWQGRRPLDLGERELGQAARLMLADAAYRSAIGWPVQLLRIAPHRWPAQVAAMLRRRSDGGGVARTGQSGLGASLSYALQAEGRARIGDAARLSLWLQRR